MRKRYKVKIVDVLGIEHVSIPSSDYPTNVRHIKERTDLYIETFDVNGAVATTFFNTDHVVSITIFEEEVK